LRIIYFQSLVQGLCVAAKKGEKERRKKFPQLKKIMLLKKVLLKQKKEKKTKKEREEKSEY
jgi:hypothetical protein